MGLSEYSGLIFVIVASLVNAVCGNLIRGGEACILLRGLIFGGLYREVYSM